MAWHRVQQLPQEHERAEAADRLTRQTLRALVEGREEGTRAAGDSTRRTADAGAAAADLVALLTRPVAA
jgi:hypothetical protein